MATEGTEKVGSRRKTSRKPATVETTPGNVEDNPMSGESTVNVESKADSPKADDVVEITPRPLQEDQSPNGGALQLRKDQPISMVWNRPVMPSKDIDVAESYSVAGVRPIASSDIQVYDTFLNNRPIISSSLKLFNMLPGDRPIFYHDVKYVDGAILPGERPIAISHPALMEAAVLPGGRPIAPNDIVDEDAPVLMGYLD